MKHLFAENPKPKPKPMDTSNIQVLLFQHIKQSLPTHVSMVDEIADLLHISNDSAYRRIRGEKEISLSELKILSEHFKISIDQVLQLQNELVVFRAPEINAERVTFQEYLEAMLQYMKHFNTFSNKKMLYFCKDITFYHFYLYPEIAAFKTFFWSKTIKDLPEYKGKLFSLEEFPLLDCFKLGQDIIKEYNKIPSLELWNAESINSTLSQLRYYKDGGYFRHADDLNIVLDSFQKCLDHIELEVEKGIKFMPGDPEIVYRAPIQFYVNEVIIGSNTILMELDETKLSFVTYNVLSYIITKDPRFNEKAFANFFTLVSRSSQISGTGEKDRNRFFNAMREKVNALRT
ncbi:helix-turn-helix domain-containing protein [Lacibacter sp. H407]|uniref:helix-turn-helix domain-containing protein n=1 Tax=Lacibacter sp. H407 TaxID=3133423 RepID=UPI0030C410E0